MQSVCIRLVLRLTLVCALAEMASAQATVLMDVALDGVDTNGGALQSPHQGSGITAVTKSPMALRQPPDLPSTEEEMRYGQRRYGLAFPIQIGPRTAALLVNRRCEGGVDAGDLEDGSDVIVFDDLRSISPTGATAIVRNAILPDAATGGKRLFVTYPARGGFVPIGARRADGTPHPHAGTGFCISPALGSLLTEKGKRIVPDPKRPETQVITHTRLHQLSFDGKQIRLVEQSPPPGKPLETEDSRWRLALPGMTMAIPDGDDLLLPVSGSGKGRFCGVARWARRSGAWRPVSFMPVPETESLKILTEPSLARDLDGALLLTARKGDRTQKDAFALRVWRSQDAGESWERVVDVPATRDAGPLSIGTAADGTPFVAGKPGSGGPLLFPRGALVVALERRPLGA